MSTPMVIDLSNYKDRVGSRVVPGRYRVVVEDVEADQSKAGNPMINLWFRVQGGEFDGQTLVDRLTITEKALFRVVGFLNAIGMPTPKKRLQVNPQKFLGQILEVDVEDGEPYNGRVKSEVRGYLRVPKAQRNSGESASDGLAEFSSEGAEEADVKPETAAGPESADETSDDEGVNLDDLDL